MSKLFNWEPEYYPHDGFIATRQVCFEKYNPIPLILISTPVAAVTRRIRATWTQQMAEDLATFQSIDVELEKVLLNPNYTNTQTRTVIVEKWKPNSMLETESWTSEFTDYFYKMFAPPQ